jgi:type IX secretion system PorP/SprF family membrane protein
MNKVQLLIHASLIIIICSFLPYKLKAQDAQFSQFYNSPLFINPSLTGAFDGNNRVFINYRNQWSSITTPYKTFAFSYDMGLMKKKEGNGFLGVGISFLSDKAGSSQLGLNQVNLSLAYHVQISEYNNISAGIMGGFAQRSIDYSNLQWASQFNSNNVYDPNLPSFESGISQNKSYGDFGAGVEWAYSKGEMYATANNQLNVNAGLAVFHINQPNVAFLSTEKDQLPVKFVFHGNSQIGFSNSKYSIVPSFLYVQQGTTKDIIAEGMLRIKLIEESKYTGFVKGAALSLGGEYRIDDAIIPQVQLEFSNYAMGLSYDVNTSGLTTATSGRGGFEISLRWINPNPFTGKTVTKTPRFFN